jgi:2-dehydropantoate 2-reductase
MQLATSPFHHTVVVGAGAVGGFYGGMLARAGHRVTLIARPLHVAAIARDGLQLDLAHASGVEAVALQASSDLSVLRDADLVLFCVKSTDTESLAKQMAPFLAPHAVVMSLQNGVENAADIAAHIAHAVIPAVVYVATEMPAPGYIKHHGRGDLVIGTMPLSRLHDPHHTLQQLVELFATAQVPVQISPDVMSELWFKLLINCVFNAISGLSQMPYAKLAELDSVRVLQHAVVHEVIAVAKADGVQLSEQTALQSVAKIPITMAHQKSSTAQDMARRKPSEIDHLNGFIVRRGQALGVATPVNQSLYALVKLVESGYSPDA